MKTRLARFLALAGITLTAGCGDDSADVDAQVIGWLREAYEQAA